MARTDCRFVHVPQVTVTYRFHTDNLTYGGADPDRTSATKRLLDAAPRGELGWDEYAERVEGVWS